MINLEFFATRDEMLQVLLDLQDGLSSFQIVGAITLERDKKTRRAYLKDLCFNAVRNYRSFYFAPNEKSVQDDSDVVTVNFPTWPELRTHAFRTEWTKHHRGQLYIRFDQSPKEYPDQFECLREMRKIIRRRAKYPTYNLQKYFRENEETRLVRWFSWVTEAVYQDYKAANGVLGDDCLGSDCWSWGADCVTPVVPDWWEGEIPKGPIPKPRQ